MALEMTWQTEWSGASRTRFSEFDPNCSTVSWRARPVTWSGLLINKQKQQKQTWHLLNAVNLSILKLITRLLGRRVVKAVDRPSNRPINRSIDQSINLGLSLARTHARALGFKAGDQLVQR